MDNKIVETYKSIVIYGILYLAGIVFMFGIILATNEGKIDIFECVLFPILFLYGLFIFIYFLIYRFEVDDDTIRLRTLFGKKEINIYEINYYSVKLFSNRRIYMFKLYENNKKTTICTRYKDEFEAILQKHGVERTL